VLRLHDTATGTIEPLVLRDPGHVSMYVCGPTVYDVPHIGHGRFALAFDILRRYLEFTGLEVRYVSNITDIDDKIIARAQRENRTLTDVAREFEAAWFAALDGLDVKRPTVSPRATEYVEDMVALVENLVARDDAYETSDGVYLSVDRVAGYGLLARQSLDSLRSGARVDPGEEKRSPLDFVLWKKAKPGEPTWPSPWGDGRPGWHTECVVMSLDLLGDGFDLHGGGIDLAFPHHENERAQAVATGRTFTHHWVHNGHVMMSGEKMSKSLGNFTSLTDLLERTDGRAYRLLLLRSHYRSQVEVSPDTITDAEESLVGLDALVRRFDLADVAAAVTATEALELGADADSVRAFLATMDADLGTPAAVGALFELARRANIAADQGDQEEGRRLALTVLLLFAALGLALEGGREMLDEATAALVAERDAARAARDFDRADAIRAELEADGWFIEDGPDGGQLHR
jgi:cysteinyl-tRNA synthetase